MFATKKCLLAWFKYYLNKINGVYVCPVTGDIGILQFLVRYAIQGGSL